MQNSLNEVKGLINEDQNLMTDDLVNNTNPTNHPKLKEISLWMASLASLIPKAVKQYAEEPQSEYTSTKNFIEQKDGNLDKIYMFIRNEVLGDRFERERYFPCLG